MGLHFNNTDDDIYIKSGTYSSNLVCGNAKFSCTITHISTYMPHLVISNRISVFDTFIDKFGTYYNGDISQTLFTDTETITLKDLEPTQKLFGTHIT